MMLGIFKTLGISLPDLVEKQIEKIFLYKSAQTGCKPQDLRFVLSYDKNNKVHIYPLNSENKYLSELSKKEIETILV